MVGGFACDRCDHLHTEHPGSCVECGHEELRPLTYSEFRSRRRGGEDVDGQPSRRGRTAVLALLTVGLVVIGLVAVGIGVAQLTGFA
jgi:hypothetical protein